MQFLRSLVDLIPTHLNKESLARILGVIEARLKALEGTRANLEETIDGLQQVALDRINVVLTPAIESVQAIQERGFLLAHSSTSATLGVGNVFTFVVSDPDERATFTPSPYVALTREDNAVDFAVARTVSYDRTEGELLVEIVSFEGAPGPHADWVIGALAGATVAQVTMMEECSTSSAAAVAAKDIAVIKAAEATSAANRAETAAEAFEAGGVASVNGKVGIVTLGSGDIAGLDTAIAAKAPKADPTFTGTVTVPTPTQTDIGTKAANTAWVQTWVEAKNYLTGLIDGSVTTAKLAAGAVTGNKLADGAVEAAAKIADGVVTFAKMATAAVATVAELRAKTGSKLLSTAVFDAADFVTLTYASTMNIDFGSFLGCAQVTLTGPVTLGTTSNVKKGTSGWIEITHGASHTLSYNATYWKTRDGEGITLPTSAGTSLLFWAACGDGKVFISLASKPS